MKTVMLLIKWHKDQIIKFQYNFYEIPQKGNVIRGIFDPTGLNDWMIVTLVSFVGINVPYVYVRPMTFREVQETIRLEQNELGISDATKYPEDSMARATIKMAIDFVKKEGGEVGL